MEFKSETKILLTSFSLIGIPFYGRRRSSLTCYIKLCLKIFAEFLFTLFGLYNILSTNFYFRSINPLFVLTRSMMSVSILLLRLTIIYKRNQIIELISHIQRFLLAYQKKPYLSKRKLITYTCFFNVCVPLAAITIFTIFFLKDYEDIEEDLKPDLLRHCSRRFNCERLVVFLINIIHSLHCYVTPSLCMTLFIFLYDTYQDALEQMLAEASEFLKTSITPQGMARTTDLVSKATQVHAKIESVLSLSIFATYVLVFVNFLNVMLVSLSHTDHPKSLFRLVGYCVIFKWTLSCFFKLTLTGSRLVEICDKWRLQQQEVVLSCSMQGSPRDPTELAQLLVFLEVSRLDLAFTGWGMFRLDRTLILTMTEVIVSYSVLIATL